MDGDGQRTAGLLSVVSTPIGNLQDITLRAMERLTACDLVVAEDQRRTRALLTHHGIHVRCTSFPAFDEQRRVAHFIGLLEEGLHLCLVSDAGTPVVSDPGRWLIAEARGRGVRIEVIPGPSAVTAALALTGYLGDRFHFLGFLPRSPGKMRAALTGVLDSGGTVIFFESALRISRTLKILSDALGNRRVSVCREMTKIHESVHEGTADELSALFLAHPPKGECTVLVGGKV